MNTIYFLRGYILEQKYKPEKSLPLATGDTAIKLTKAAPVPWPMRVTRSGSPPKAGKFSLSQWSPATRSIRPKFP